MAPNYSKANAILYFFKGRPMGHINTGFPDSIGSFDAFDSKGRMSEFGRDEELKLFLEPFSNIRWKFLV